MKENIKSSRLVAVVAAAALLSLTGCAMTAPPYQPSLGNVELLKKSPGSVAVGAFSVKSDAPGATGIGLRGSSMTSPIGADYAAYLAEALRQDLTLAGKLSPQSKIEISGFLLKNDIAAGGFSTNSGEIEARFIVKNAGEQRYDRVKRVEMSWDSSFMGAVAIPKAQQQYPLLVQKLLSELLSDADFQVALK